jgi:hypothetical protein
MALKCYGRTTAAAFLRRRAPFLRRAPFFRAAFLRPPFLRPPFLRPPFRRAPLRAPFLRDAFLRDAFLRAAIFNTPLSVMIEPEHIELAPARNLYFARFQPPVTDSVPTSIGLSNAVTFGFASAFMSFPSRLRRQ